jgi:hypothetical protein
MPKHVEVEVNSQVLYDRIEKAKLEFAQHAKYTGEKPLQMSKER